MKAAVITPGRLDLAKVVTRAKPKANAHELLVEGLLVGVCSIDVEIARHGHGQPPPGHDDIVLFHESLGRVQHAPADSDFTAGDLITGMVRRPDPVPCEACAAGAWDYCHNGRYLERGIKGLDGYGSQWWTIPPEYAVRVDPALGELGVLIEPAAAVAKAWDQAIALSKRSFKTPRSALIIGAGTIGLLAAMMGVQRGLEVHVVDRIVVGSKPDLVTALGAKYHSSLAAAPNGLDIAIEATGMPEFVWESARRAATAVLACACPVNRQDTGKGVPGTFNDMVLQNRAMVGSISAGARDYHTAAACLIEADKTWLNGLITKRVALDHFADSFERSRDDVKVVVDLA